MANVDDELKRALDESEATDEETVAEVPAESPPSKKGLGVLLVLLAVGGGILALVLSAPADNISYSKTVADVLDDWEGLGERNLRVQGHLVHGSLLKREDPCEYRFKIRQKDGEDKRTVPVRFASCIVPDTFRDVKGMDVEVTVEGTLASDFVQAKQIFAKCPSKYEMKELQASGTAAPHSMELPPVPGADG